MYDRYLRIGTKQSFLGIRQHLDRLSNSIPSIVFYAIVSSLFQCGTKILTKYLEYAILLLDLN